MIAGQRCVWLGLTLAVGMTPAVRGEAPLPLREQFPANYQYHVSSRVEISGSLTLPAEQGKPAPKPLPVAGTSALEYDERVLAAGSDGQVQKAGRI